MTRWKVRLLRPDDVRDGTLIVMPAWVVLRGDVIHGLFGVWENAVTHANYQADQEWWFR